MCFSLSSSPYWRWCRRGCCAWHCCWSWLDRVDVSGLSYGRYDEGQLSVYFLAVLARHVGLPVDRLPCATWAINTSSLNNWPRRRGRLVHCLFTGSDSVVRDFGSPYSRCCGRVQLERWHQLGLGRQFVLLLVSATPLFDRPRLAACCTIVAVAAFGATELRALLVAHAGADRVAEHGYSGTSVSSDVPRGLPALRFSHTSQSRKPFLTLNPTLTTQGLRRVV